MIPINKMNEQELKEETKQLEVVLRDGVITLEQALRLQKLRKALKIIWREKYDRGWY